MFKTKQQKIIFFTAILCAVVLIFVTVWQSTPFQYLNTVDYKKLAEEDAKQQEAYKKYLQAIQPDPVASQDLFKELITEQDVKAEVEKELNVNQKIELPKIDESQLVIEKNSNKDTLVNYFAQVSAQTQDFNNKVFDSSKLFFSESADSETLASVADYAFRFEKNIAKTPVPTEAVAFQKASLATFRTYQDLTKVAREYYGSPEESKPWPEVYKNYAIINQELATAKAEFNKLDQKYSLSDVPAIHLAKTGSEEQGFRFIKKADAVFGLGDTTIIVGNIPEEIEKAAKQALAAAFSKFITIYLDKLITAIEKNYKIANFLYYTDAVIRGQYVNDFLTKYVTDPLDRQIATRFIPQFNCGQSNDELKNVFKAKAQEYLGYDPAKVSPADPQFLQKLARAGDFMASPQGWELSYKEIANKALSEAEKAVNQELTSSGLKSPRDLIGKQISASLSAIANSQSAALFSSLNLGVVNVDKIVGKLVSGILDNLFNKFLFKGATVLKEQNACIAVPQIQPVIPTTHTQYEDPTSTSTSGDGTTHTEPAPAPAPADTPAPTPGINPRN